MCFPLAGFRKPSESAVVAVIRGRSYESDSAEHGEPVGRSSSFHVSCIPSALPKKPALQSDNTLKGSKGLVPALRSKQLKLGKDTFKKKSFNL